MVWHEAEHELSSPHLNTQWLNSAHSICSRQVNSEVEMEMALWINLPQCKKCNV